jgi:hypothetical protein
MLTGPTSLHFRFFALLVVAIGLSMPARAARAEADASVLANITALNRKALDDYDSLNFDEARSGLEAALALCDRNGLESHPLRAQTYLNLGVVALAADAGHPEVAAAHFRRALQIQADVRLSERVANPDVQRAFAAAKADVEVAPIRPPPRAPARAKADADDDADVSASANDEDVSAPDDAGASGGARWVLAFGVGSGIGWASGTGEVNTDVKVPSGFQPSSVVHLAPEIGFFVRPTLLLSLQGRFQFISGTTPERDPSQTMCGADHLCAASNGATAVFVKASWFLAQGPVRPYLGAALGYGQIRHVVTLPGHDDCGADPAHPVACVDTVAAGPIFAGPGGGLLFQLAPHFALTLGATALLGFSTFTFQVDVNGGIAVEL